MKLRPAPFFMIKSGQKTVELRLYDEKRRLIAVGDTIEFSNTDDPRERVCCRVIALHLFDSFASLYRALPLTKCGYTTETAAQADPRDMDAYYSPEEQSRYGVVGIEIELT